MHRRQIAAAWFLLFACTPEASDLHGEGAVCGDPVVCATDLTCVHLICRDDCGPDVQILLPEVGTVYDAGIGGILTVAAVDGFAPGDQLEWFLDPESGSAALERIAVDEGQLDLSLSLAGGLTPGPHHVRARVIDADGQAYPNPSSSLDVPIFIDNPADPGAAQVAIVWPPSGYQHRLGDPLEVELIWRNFELVESGDVCLPIPGCTPAFGAACEDSCGPVIAQGNLKLFVTAEFPGCLLTTPSCVIDYIQVIRPPSSKTDQITGQDARVTVLGDRLRDAGSVPLEVSLSSNDHQPFPSAEAVGFDRVTLDVLE